MCLSLFTKLLNIFAKLLGMFTELLSLFIKLFSLFIKLLGLFTKLLSLFTKLLSLLTKLLSLFTELLILFTKSLNLFTKLLILFTKLLSLFTKLLSLFTVRPRSSHRYTNYRLLCKYKRRSQEVAFFECLEHDFLKKEREVRIRDCWRLVATHVFNVRCVAFSEKLLWVGSTNASHFGLMKIKSYQLHKECSSLNLSKSSKVTILGLTFDLFWCEQRTCWFIGKKWNDPKAKLLMTNLIPCHWPTTGCSRTLH